jgi:putative protease
VQQLAEMGFRRVVLARELSIQEIAAIHKAVPKVELEVFVHGALCVSYSGRCYASEYCFGRSANRGECAQFCRLPFTLKDADGNIIEQDKHLLSLKDFAQLNNLERLVEAGAVSFKIEGRLKDVDYVKNVTAAYSQKINSIINAHPDLYQRASMGKCSYTFQPDIHKSFNRGFTTYFADGRCADQASFLTPKSIGEYVGRVKEIRGNSFNVSSVTSFANGDGMCFFSPQGKLIGFRVNKAEGNRIFPHKMPVGITPGTLLYRNYDQTFQKLLSKPSAERRVMLSMTFTITPTELQLSATDEHGNTGTATMPYEYQKANTPQEDNIRRQLTKSGGTIYNIAHLQINAQVETPFIPSSHLATLRRQCLEEVKGGQWKKEEGRKFNWKKGGKVMEETNLHPSSINLHPNKPSSITHHPSSITSPNWGRPGGGLMHSRYCLRHELGYCTKSGRKAPWREPLTLHLADGKSFNIKFDCKQCEMYIMR